MVEEGSGHKGYRTAVDRSGALVSVSRRIEQSRREMTVPFQDETVTVTVNPDAGVYTGDPEAVAKGNMIAGEWVYPKPLEDKQFPGGVHVYGVPRDSFGFRTFAGPKL